MEAFNDEKIEAIDKQLEDLKRALGRFDVEESRTLVLKPTLTEKTARPKLNYGLNERKYDYDHIKKLEMLDEAHKVIVTPKIDKNWLAANIEAPDVMDFYEENEVFRPSSNFSKDFKNQHIALDTQLEKTIRSIVNNDSLHDLNSRDFDYVD